MSQNIRQCPTTFVHVHLRWQKEISGQRESNPFRRFRNVAQFQRKYALDCALQVKVQISEFARIAQNYAVRLSEIVRTDPFLCSLFVPH